MIAIAGIVTISFLKHRNLILVCHKNQVLKIGLLTGLKFFTNQPIDQSELICFSYLYQDYATRKKREFRT